MSNKNLLLLPFIGLLLLTSCEDIIDVTLDDAEPIFVIDAWVNNTTNVQEIKLSFSQPFFDSTVIQGINEAEVIIRSANQEFVFEPDNSGLFTYDPATNGTLGNIGDNLELQVIANNITYSSNTVLNRVPPIDSISQEFVIDDPFLDDGIYCNFLSRDLPGEGDTYWIKTFKNDTFLNRPTEINIAFDAGFDSGAEVDSLIFIPPIRDLANEIDENFASVPWEIGEVIRVEIHSISLDAFRFIEITRDQLLNSSNGIFAEPLANTRSNITSSDNSSVLGIFNVAAISSLSDTIREQ